MANKLIIAFFFFSLVGTVLGKCANRVINISYKAAGPETIQVFRMRGSNIRGPPILTIDTAGCSKVYCERPARCNTCYVTIKASDLPLFYTRRFWRIRIGTYGIKFATESCPFLAITSDWRLRQSSWFAKNGFIAGCKPRVACRTRGGKSCRGNSLFDVAVTAAGCYTNLYGYGNAPTLGQCMAGNIGGGVPSGEVYGTNCPERPL